MRGLSACVHADLAVDTCGGQAVHALDRHAVVAPFPVLTAVDAGMDRSEKCAGEHGAGGALEDDRADVLAAERALRLAPLAAVALEQHQSILSGRPQLTGTLRGRVDVGAAVGKSDRHKSPPAIFQIGRLNRLHFINRGCSRSTSLISTCVCLPCAVPAAPA